MRVLTLLMILGLSSLCNMNLVAALPVEEIVVTYFEQACSRDFSGLSEDQYLAMGASFQNSEEYVERNDRFPHIPCLSNNSLLDLHANRVNLGNHEVICTQYPKAEQMEAFWNTAANEGCTIVDLTKKGEVTPTYFPEPNEEKTFNETSVKCIAFEDLDENMRLFTYEVQSNEFGATKVERIHFHQWQDRGALDFAVLSALMNELSLKEHLMIHCKAGIGRTGTVTMALELHTRCANGDVTAHNYRQMIDALIITGRLSRGDKFVQTFVQYQSLVWFTENLLGLPTTPVTATIPLDFPSITKQDVIKHFGQLAAAKNMEQLPAGTWLPHYADGQKMISYINHENKLLHRNYGSVDTDVSKGAIDLDLAREGFQPNMIN